MANLSHLSGFPASINEIQDRMGGSEAGEAALESIRGNLTRNAVDLDMDRLTLGSWMSLDDSGTTLNVHDPKSELVAQALFKSRHYRRPYVVPKKV